MYHVCCTFTSCSNNFYRALDANPHPAHRAPTASPTALARGRSRRFGRAHLDSYAAIDHVSSWGEKPFLGKLRLCHSLGSCAVVPNLNHARVEITGGYVRISTLALAPRTSCAAGYEKDSSEKRSNFTIACGELGATVNERIEAAGSEGLDDLRRTNSEGRAYLLRPCQSSASRASRSLCKVCWAEGSCLRGW